MEPLPLMESRPRLWHSPHLKQIAKLRGKKQIVSSNHNNNNEQETKLRTTTKARYRRLIGMTAKREVATFFALAATYVLRTRVEKNAAITLTYWLRKRSKEKRKIRFQAARLIQTQIRIRQAKNAIQTQILVLQTCRAYSARRIQRQFRRQKELKCQKHSILTIQRTWRGSKDRKLAKIQRRQAQRLEAIVKETKATCILQQRWRKKIARKIKEKNESIHTNAVICIQTAYKRYLGRLQYLEQQENDRKLQFETAMKMHKRKREREACKIVLLNTPLEVILPDSTVSPEPDVDSIVDYDKLKVSGIQLERDQHQAAVKIQCRLRIYIEKIHIRRLFERKRLQISITKQQKRCVLIQLKDVVRVMQKSQEYKEKKATSSIISILKKNVFQVRKKKLNRAALCIQRWVRRYLAQTLIDLLRCRTLQALKPCPSPISQIVCRMLYQAQPNIVQQLSISVPPGIRCSPSPKLWKWDASYEKWVRQDQVITP